MGLQIPYALVVMPPSTHRWRRFPKCFSSTRADRSLSMSVNPLLWFTAALHRDINFFCRFAIVALASILPLCRIAVAFASAKSTVVLPRHPLWHFVSSSLPRRPTIALCYALVSPLPTNLQLLCRSPIIVSALPCSSPVIAFGGALISSVFATFCAGSALHSALLPFRGEWLLLWWYVGGSGPSHC
jgi:hypothetical protein